LSDERPEVLLKSALEKIIYFEARSEQLSTDLAASREEAERLRRALVAASEREIALRAQLAEYEVTAARLQHERQEQIRIHEALRHERQELIGKLIEASRIHQAGDRLEDEDQEETAFDLAAFISELRSEALGREAPASTPAPAPAAASARAAPARAPALAVAAVAASTAPSKASPVTRHAERLLQQGRLTVSSAEYTELAGQPEETLFGFSLRELSAPQPSGRIRAAERLHSLKNVAAAPALATALNSETEPEVLVALLTAFADLAGSEGPAVVLPHLRSPSPEVRITALKALLRLDAAQAAPHLSAAMKDPDRAVRRRASLLALGLSGDEALRLGEEAAGDADAKVRALGALALGAAGGERARSRLTGLLRDPDAAVRQAASKSLSRILGADVSGVVSLDDAHRRREIRKLAALPSRPVTSFISSAPAGAEPAPRRVAPAVKPAVASAPVPVPVVSRPEPAPDEALCAALLSELRISIRGRTVADLALAANAAPDLVEEACALLVARGQVVKRGLKYFVA
jgi:hypothetical protein